MRQRVQRLIEGNVVQIVAVTDPLTLGFRRQAMIGVKTEGDIRDVADTLAAIPEVDYVVVVAGSFDLLFEVVCEDDEHLLDVLNDKVRTIPGVRSTETFTYLRLLQADLRVGNPMSDDTSRQPHRRRRPSCDELAPTSPLDALQPARARTGPRDPDHRRGARAATSGTTHGKRYLDGLSGLFTVQVGHGRRELAEPAREQAETLEYFPIWTLRAPAGDRARGASSPSSRPATSTASSSPPADRRRSSRRGSSPASTSAPSARASATR